MANKPTYFNADLLLFVWFRAQPLPTHPPQGHGGAQRGMEPSTTTPDKKMLLDSDAGESP
jgi:hypothetical protein